MKTLLILALLAQPDSSLLAISGADIMEELDETQVELFQNLASHPLDINFATRSRLAGSGLFTPFQTASLIEYRTESGDILSLEELAAIDGFGEKAVKALAPYISLASAATVGQSSAYRGVSGSFAARLWGKTDGEGAISYASKLKLEAPGRASAAIALKQSYRQKPGPPEVFNWSAAYYGRKVLGKVILGDFNARFGQGLLLWSGFSLSSLSSIQAFYRRPSGLSPSFSYTESGLTGAAADFNVGRFLISTALGLPKKGLQAVPLLSATWYGRYGQIGAGAARNEKGVPGVSADSRWNIGKFDIFTEAAMDLAHAKASAIAGVVWNMDYDLKAAGRLSLIPECMSAAAGAQLRRVFLSAEAAFKQSGTSIKYLANIPVTLWPAMDLALRLSGRLARSSSRIQLRSSLDWSTGRLSARLRTEALYGKAFACLLYMEPGFITECLSIYARATLFAADNWDDRIYAYERDAPGSFNMKAYYGRGGALSAVLGWKIKKQRVHLRASLIKSDRSNSAELHAQYSIEF